MSRGADLIRFYGILETLEEKAGGKRRLAECDGHMDWPRRGVYFLFEVGEARSDTGDGMRVVRVGTDALKPNAGATLWGRLRQHRGSLKTGGGNHRASIFRLLVGTAIGKIWGDNSPITWGVGGSASEAARTMHCRFSIATSHVTGLTPPRHRGASGNLRPFVGGQLLRSCPPALQASKAAENHGRWILPVGPFGQRFPRRLLRHPEGDLVYVLGTLLPSA